MSGIPIVSGLHALIHGSPREVKPAAFDPQRPNHRGYDTRPILRLVEAGTQNEVLAVQLPHRPQTTLRSAEVRMAVHPTAGGYHVDRPRAGAEGLIHYVITGQSGVWPLGRKDGAPDGMAVIHAVKAVLDAFAAGSLNNRPASDFELVLIDPDAPVTEEDPTGDSAYVCVPERSLVDLQRVAQSAQTWRYTIRLACLGRAMAPMLVSVSDEKEQSLFRRALGMVAALQAFDFDTVFARYQQAIGPVLQVRAALQDVRRFAEGWARGVRTFVGYNVALLGSTVDDLTALMNLVRGEELADDRARTPEDRFGSDGSALRQAAEIRLRLARLREALVATPGVLTPDLTAGDRIGIRAGVDGQASPMQAANGAGRLSVDDQRQGRARAAAGGTQLASRLVTVGWGQTLDDLVPPGFTDLDVLALNPDLEWPFVDGAQERAAGDSLPTAGEMRVAYCGDAIRVPAEAGQAPATARGTSPGAAAALVPQESEDERVFGRDLLVDPRTRSLQLDPATSDLRTVAGMPNLLARLRRSLLIPVGALPHARRFGSYLIAEAQGRWASDLQLRLNAIAVDRTIRQDPAIGAVRRVRLAASDGSLLVSFEADTVDGTGLGRLSLAV